MRAASAIQNVNLNSEEASQVNFDGICKLNRDPPARCNLAAFSPLDSKSVTVSPLRAGSAENLSRASGLQMIGDPAVEIGQRACAHRLFLRNRLLVAAQT